MPSRRLIFSKKRTCVCVALLLMVLVVLNSDTVVNMLVSNSLDVVTPCTSCAGPPKPAPDKVQVQPPAPKGNDISAILVTVRSNASIKAGARHKKTFHRPKPIRRPGIADNKNRKPHQHPLLMSAKRPLNKTKHDIMAVVSSL